MVHYYYNSLHDAIIQGNLIVILGSLKRSLKASLTKITEKKETVLRIAIVETTKVQRSLRNC
jgi:hypothetical protein